MKQVDEDGNGKRDSQKIAVEEVLIRGYMTKSRFDYRKSCAPNNGV